MPFSNLAEWTDTFPALQKVIEMSPTIWLNAGVRKVQETHISAVTHEDMEKAYAFMQQAAEVLSKLFPQTSVTHGVIESPLREIEHFKKAFYENGEHPVEGRLFLKCDNELPVAGSIKARGGFYEVLQFAFSIAKKQSWFQNDEFPDLSAEKYRQLFSQYTIGVGSTGNLGLSIGIISATLGFKVKVFMSNDAKEWKKQLLREHGACVIEIEGDFGAAITKGRQETVADPMGYFVDDENSRQLFLGYSLAAFELKHQLDSLGIVVDQKHPLFVYSPCGVGGSPGGVMYGLKQVYGDAVYSFFAEPTHSPAVLTGLITGKKEKVCVQDFGIDNKTEADGLAVGRPSAFASGIIEQLVSGIYTLEDEDLFRLQKKLYETENIFVEPSATAGLVGPGNIMKTGFLKQQNFAGKDITHVAWATGGSLVPPNLKKLMLSKR